MKAFWPAENLRRAGRVPAGVVATLLAVESHRDGGAVFAGLRGHEMEDTHLRGGWRRPMEK